MIPEFEIISTNSPDHVIKAQLMYISACEEEGKQVPENPYGMIEEFGYVANVIGNQDDLSAEDMEDAKENGMDLFYMCTMYDDRVESEIIRH